MRGIFYDPIGRKVTVIEGTPEPHWQLVTHNTAAPVHHCRRIMREFVEPGELSMVDWTAVSAGRR